MLLFLDHWMCVTSSRNMPLFDKYIYIYIYETPRNQTTCVRGYLVLLVLSLLSRHRPPVKENPLPMQFFSFHYINYLSICRPLGAGHCRSSSGHYDAAQSLFFTSLPGSETKISSRNPPTCVSPRASPLHPICLSRLLLPGLGVSCFLLVEGLT